jgi:hypothetical protein
MQLFIDRMLCTDCPRLLKKALLRAEPPPSFRCFTLSGLANNSVLNNEKHLSNHARIS